MFACKDVFAAACLNPGSQWEHNHLCFTKGPLLYNLHHSLFQCLGRTQDMIFKDQIFKQRHSRFHHQLYNHEAKLGSTQIRGPTTTLLEMLYESFDEHLRFKTRK